MNPYYQHDGITIYHGDCREILPQLPKVDLVLTDPPYGIDLRNHDTAGISGRVSISVSDYRVAGDQSGEVARFVIEWATSLSLPIIVFASPKNPWPYVWRQSLVWDKGGAVGGGGDIATCWKFDWELIQVARTGKLNGSRDCSVLRFPIGMGDLHYHPTEKPVSLISYLAMKTTQSGDLILDPFLGSGTTLVACKRLGRQGIGIEIEEKYCEIAAKRVEAERLTLFESAGIHTTGDMFAD
jgi:DNA modification methylase